MNVSNKRRENLLRFEFWAVTTLYVFFLFFWITDHAFGNNEFYDRYKELFNNAGLQFHYYTDLFLPTLVDYLSWYAAFWVLNFYLVPKMLNKEYIIRNLFFAGLVFVCIAVLDFGSDRLRLAYLYVNSEDPAATTMQLMRNVSMETFQFGVMFCIYTGLKYTALYFLRSGKTAEKKQRTVQRNGIDALIVWIMSMFILFIAESPTAVLLGWGLIAPVGILLYMYSSYTLIPKALRKPRSSVRYMIKVVLLMVLLFFPLFLFSMLSAEDEDLAFGITMFNVVVQVFITAPLSWVLYKRQLKGKEEMFVLQKELEQSTANLDFLRSQINPHFLFNALNTIYGTAIMEHAERTSEGIEKLSDMMRFMLQENMQEKIALTREIDYLNNYISLQRLRTDTSPIVQINTNIQESVNGFEVAPMLLIPFVENAFKHGISFRESSEINVQLQLEDKSLYFKVYNTKHPKQENDPEKYKSGVGLVNVQQRLQLLYPRKHELRIEETDHSFFVFLNLQLA